MVINYEDYFKQFKKTMKGKPFNDKHTFFLVNDSNNEIEQHYKKDYKSKFSENRFKISQKSKMNFFNKKNLNYNLFVVPDKSVVLQDYLPFETDTPKRNVNILKNYLYDLLPIVTKDDYQINDTHVSSFSAVKIVSFILNKMHNDKTMLYYAERLWDNLDLKIDKVEGDFFSDVNWGYEKNDEFLYYKYFKLEILYPKYELNKISEKEIPREFRAFGSRKSVYYHNEHSISDKKAVVFHDSTTLRLMDILSIYYRDVFFYWDHGYLNNDLIKWFNPSDIIEIRTERMLENSPCIPLDDDGNLHLPFNIDLENISIDNNKLTLDLSLKDLHNMKPSLDLNVYINEQLIDSNKVIDGLFNKSYDLLYLDSNKFILKIIFLGTKKYKELEFKKELIIN